MGTKFLKFLTGFRKNHNKQYALLRMTGNWKIKLDKSNNIGVIIKAFDTLTNNLLAAKRKAYGLDLNATSFIKSYLTKGYQHWGIVY